MEPTFTQRLKQFGKDHQDFELVFTANGFSSIAIALYLGWELGLSGGLIVAGIPVVFIAQAICLLFRATMWIPAVFGIFTLGGIAAVMGWIATSERSEFIQWLGAGLAFVAVGAFALWCYRGVAKILWSPPARD